jgi:hypothetical protein
MIERFTVMGDFRHFGRSSVSTEFLFFARSTYATPKGVDGEVEVNV